MSSHVFELPRKSPPPPLPPRPALPKVFVSVPPLNLIQPCTVPTQIPYLPELLMENLTHLLDQHPQAPMDDDLVLEDFLEEYELLSFGMDSSDSSFSGSRESDKEEEEAIPVLSKHYTFEDCPKEIHSKHYTFEERLKELSPIHKPSNSSSSKQASSALFSWMKNKKSALDDHFQHSKTRPLSPTATTSPPPPHHQKHTFLRKFSLTPPHFGTAVVKRRLSLEKKDVLLEPRRHSFDSAVTDELRPVARLSQRLSGFSILTEDEDCKRMSKFFKHKASTTPTNKQIRWSQISHMEDML